MISGPDVLILPMAIALAAGSGGHKLACTVPQAPQVMVRVTTDQIDYDFSQTAKALTALKGDTLSPYAPGADTVSGGLREDHPAIKSEIKWQVMYEERSDQACMWYDSITINIHLDPKIYVAREFNVGACREEILRHERKHVDIDQTVMNKYGRKIGEAVQKAVDAAGAVGPFRYSNIEEMKGMASNHIESAINSQKLLMEKEMRQLQGQVDSLAEYERISAVCKSVKVLR